jgi:hypothetical protein
VIHEVTPPAPAGAFGLSTDTTILRPEGSEAMYDMYPEWGPAKHRTEDVGAAPQLTALQTALDLRDNGGQRPDDN